MTKAIKFVRPLTPREKQVLSWVKAGLANKEIARKLQISPGVVKRHIEKLFLKSGAFSRKAFLKHSHK